ncbi:hypothetical protein OG226_20630 [Streptomyces sp. NBC_01261]|uniref:hypothetical protein n=1 Tax=Streptomyces sp. NBC_01261 TaxID=2903802 RepID=UPI002E367DBE|nr:hypothetical protein [Streptomyces sp. NBC_01261]
MSVSDGRKSYDSGGAGEGAGTGEGTGRRRVARDGHAGASRLPAELRALGRSLDARGGGGGEGEAAGSETMVERVLAQILAEQIPVPVPVPGPTGVRARVQAVRRWMRMRRRALVAALCGVLTVLVLTPPVRAAVFDWFGFGGVEVRYDPSAVPSAGAVVPGCGRSVTLAQAGRRAGFEPVVPDALGVPDAVTVTGEPRGRFLVSLCWREGGHTVRIDEYPARLDVGFAKSVREPPEWLSLDGTVPPEGIQDPALWFARPHLLSFWLVDADGDRYTREERTAGPTLLWTHAVGGVPGGDLTLRLEGVGSKRRAWEIARSLDGRG